MFALPRHSAHTHIPICTEILAVNSTLHPHLHEYDRHMGARGGWRADIEATPRGGDQTVRISVVAKEAKTLLVWPLWGCTG